MSSSDIYKVKESPWAAQQKKDAQPSSQRRRRGRSPGKSFDEAVNPDFANTHRRRSSNSGFRRFRHQMKKPEYSKRFWTILLSSCGSILLVLLVWDLFFRYPDELPESRNEGLIELDQELE